MGNLVYVNSLVYLASYAVTEAFGRNAKIIVKYSIDKGIYIETNFDLDIEKCKILKAKMKELAEKTYLLQSVE